MSMEDKGVLCGIRMSMEDKGVLCGMCSLDMLQQTRKSTVLCTYVPYP